MIRNLIKIGAILGVAAALSACKHDNNTATTTPTPPTPPAAAAYNQFGAGFATDIAASSTSTPATPTAADVNAVDPTAKPLPVS